MNNMVNFSGGNVREYIENKIPIDMTGIHRLLKQYFGSEARQVEYDMGIWYLEWGCSFPDLVERYKFIPDFLKAAERAYLIKALEIALDDPGVMHQKYIDTAKTDARHLGIDITPIVNEIRRKYNMGESR